MFDVEWFELFFIECICVVVFNFFNNLIGFVFDCDDWVYCFELCYECGVCVVSDEVYWGVEFDFVRMLF